MFVIVIVAMIISDWQDAFTRSLFVGFVVVLAQLPTTYMRSQPVIGHAGTGTPGTRYI